MPDIKKTVRGLAEISEHMREVKEKITDDSMLRGMFDYWHQVAEDAIALLIEQEPVKAEHGFPDLKCPNCGTEYVSEVRYYLGKPIAEYYKYCPGCGRKVKWDGDS